MTDTHTSIQRYLIVYGFIMIWVKAANSTEYLCITHSRTVNRIVYDVLITYDLLHAIQGAHISTAISSSIALDSFL